MTMTTATTIDPGGLYRLMTWLSPSYPVGAFSYSHGIEQAVAAGWIGDRATLVAWVGHAVERGGGFADAVLLALAMRAADETALDEIADHALALKGSVELALESRQPGAAFVAATHKAWPTPALADFATRRGDGGIAYPVAVALACRGVIEPGLAVLAYLQAFAANLVSAGLRAVPLGQSDGQAALAELAPVVARTATRALAAELDDLATAAPGIDIASMRHETQYTRLFRS
ncbi:MAG: urease accessory protein UreF [Alphaproteobacteria bacterium]|nr:urease accessory protein UreF [Alphaproteobacteria bacterium]